MAWKPFQRFCPPPHVSATAASSERGHSNLKCPNAKDRATRATSKLSAAKPASRVAYRWRYFLRALPSAAPAMAAEPSRPSPACSVSIRRESDARRSKTIRWQASAGLPRERRNRDTASWSVDLSLSHYRGWTCQFLRGELLTWPADFYGFLAITTLLVLTLWACHIQQRCSTKL
jgi:hypothetical protein